MKITHIYDRSTGIVAYSCDATGKTVQVRMSDIRELKSTEQLHKLLTDRGLFDRPKYPQHPRCNASYDRYREGVFYACEDTGKFCFIPLEHLKDMDEEHLDMTLAKIGLFNEQVLCTEDPDPLVLTREQQENIAAAGKVIDLLEHLNER